MKKFLSSIKKIFEFDRNELILIFTALFITFLNNFTYYQKVAGVFGPDQYLTFLLSIVLVQFFGICLLFSFFIGGRFFKPVLMITLIISSMISYASDNFGIVIDRVMILNMVSSDVSELSSLLSYKLFFYIAIKGLIPSFIIYKIKTTRKSFTGIYLQKLKYVLLPLSLIVLTYTSQGRTFSTFFRNHKTLRFYSNPIFFVYSTFSFVNRNYFTPKLEMIQVGRDARITKRGKDKRDLIFLVVGETARADRFSLNGYQRETNPLLKKEDVISFKKMYSCGTSTAISVPCLFSNLGLSGYDEKRVRYTENLLDVLSHTKRVNIQWRDNNSNSKGVADRFSYKSYKAPSVNKICDPECRDLGMIDGLQEHIDSIKGDDILVVFHMMGSHGPEYHRRVPKDFEIFKPICRSKQLEDCSDGSINNSYDNTIIYTDFFLAELIKILKKNSNKFEAGMFYVSDHGESLGENGVYLHGLPYIFAPDEQKRVPSIVWLNDKLKKEVNLKKLYARVNQEIDHGYIFHSILGLFDVETNSYDKRLDLFN